MKTKFLILLLVFCTSEASAQIKLADKFFSNYGYVKAAELYKKAYESGETNEHVLLRLGDCYYNNSNSKKAVFWYKKAVEKYNVDAEHLFKYIQSLKSIGNYVEADIWTKKFIETQHNDSLSKDYKTDNLLIYNELNSVNKAHAFKIENLPINSKYSDFGSYFHNNKMYFASARGLEDSKKYGWNKEPFLDIYQVSVKEFDKKLEFGEPEVIKSSKINSDYHEANVAITNDGNTIYFTRDNVTRKNKLDYDKKGTTHLKIYKATLIEESWENITELPINDDKYSTGHPALSPDNKKLYFVSDREGGFGNTDIYEVDILDKNRFGKPKNLGSKINTAGREMFPFVSKDSLLYFSSDGHLNLGLLDVFKSSIIKDSLSEPQNLGAPYNSGYDDFAFFINPSNDNQRSYLSSNRPGGKGNDDIYIVYSKVCSQVIKGTIKDTKNNENLSHASVKLIDETGKIVKETTSDINGTYQLDLECEKTYTIIATTKDYSDDRLTFNTDDNNGNEIEHEFFLQSLIQGNQIVIKPIFFDFGKWNIRLDAQYELENIVDVLKLNPKMIIKIEAHTDSRGNDKFNLKLSDKRAKATRDYILSRGIAPHRIESAIGYGESQLLNECSNGVKCTEEEHQLNRRSYFYIVKK
jgi:outer membrane protein OmpA-like peptidoglycan-associated protein/tetratricopeptide (TPR) repeat protein